MLENPDTKAFKYSQAIHTYIPRYFSSRRVYHIPGTRSRQLHDLLTFPTIVSYPVGSHIPSEAWCFMHDCSVGSQHLIKVTECIILSRAICLIQHRH